MAKIEHQAYGFSTVSEKPFEDAVTSVKEALKNQGVGVLCEIDVAGTLKQNLGVEREPYLIL